MHSNLKNISNADLKYYGWILTSTVSVGLLTYALFKLSMKRRREKKRQSYPKDVVIVHQFPSSKDKPTLSAPCLKLETWLKLSGIKYQNEYSYLARSSQGQIPFVTFNQEDFHDSQFIIENLSKKFDKDLSKNLSLVEKSIARGFFKLLEESFKWTLYYHRAVHGKASDIGFPWFMFRIFRSMIIKNVKIQGYGRHTSEEVYKIGKEDLSALENFIGKKKYLFGDEPCNEDAVLFAFTAQLVYYDNGPFNKFLKENCPGLLAHFNGIKKVYWPEWKNL